MKNKVFFRNLLFVLLAGVFIAGVLIADDYGITIDDEGLWNHGNHVVLLYREALTGKFSFDPGVDNLRYYGPAFLVTATLAEGPVLSILPHFDKASVWHLLVFASFLASVVAIYYIACALFPRQIAMSVALLYLGQPLLWGHAFINAKDIPFLSFFTVSIATGLLLEKEIKTNRERKGFQLRTVLASAEQDFMLWNISLRTKITWIALVLIVITIYQVSNPFWIKPLVTNVFHSAITNPGSLAGILLYNFANNLATVPLESYISKASTWANLVLLWVIGFSWILFFVFLLKIIPSARRVIMTAVKTIPWKDYAILLRSPTVWLAGITLAVTWAIRVIAPFAGFLVAVFLLGRKKLAAVPVLCIYAVIAASGTYLLWPYLWDAPFQNLIESLTTMASFSQGHTQLLNGHIYSASELPFYSVPQILTIQLTLPIVVLFLFSIFFLLRGKTSAPAIIMLLLWFGLPLAYCILFTPTMYNNFRQWLFIIPPFFVLAGFGLQKAQNILRRQSLYWILLLLILTPGIASIIQLHPYQYIYYNPLIGGVPAAADVFELDYWSTAMRETMLELNKIAPPDSRVVIWHTNSTTAGYFARPDILVERNRGGTFDPETGYHFALIPLRSGKDDVNLYPNAPTVIAITRLGIPLAVVKQLNCSCDLDQR